MNFKKSFLISFLLILAFDVIASDYPKTREERIRDEMGSLAGDEGIVFRPKHMKKQSTRSKEKEWRKINKYLWQATEKVLSFMPVATLDTSNGVFLTDWYSTTSEPSYSFKIQVTILDNVITTEAIDVKVFERRLKNGQWYNERVSSALANKFEDQIIREARELYIKSQSK